MIEHEQNRIRKQRQDFKLSQREFALTPGIPLGTVRHWEQEKCSPVSDCSQRNSGGNSPKLGAGEMQPAGVSLWDAVRITEEELYVECKNAEGRSFA